MKKNRMYDDWYFEENENIEVFGEKIINKRCGMTIGSLSEIFFSKIDWVISWSFFSNYYLKNKNTINSINSIKINKNY